MIAKENKITSNVTCKGMSLVEQFSFSICSPVRVSEKQLSKCCARGKTGQRFEAGRGTTLKEKVVRSTVEFHLE